METKYETGKEDGIVIGEDKKALKVITKGIKMGFSNKDLAEMVEMPIEFVQKIRKEMNP
jgi:hypothetical protein